MEGTHTTRDFLALMTGGLAALALPATSLAQPGRATAQIIHRQPLPAPLEGSEASFLLVTIPPGPSSPVHRHAGFLLGYVLAGKFRFAIDGQPERVLSAGEVFYEPPGSRHTTSASALPDQEARLLAIIIAEKGVSLTTYE